MIVIDQFRSEIQVTFICSLAVLVTVNSEYCVKMVICKPGQGHWQTVQTQIRRFSKSDATDGASDQGLHCLLKLRKVKG